MILFDLSQFLDGFQEDLAKNLQTTKRGISYISYYNVKYTCI